MQHWISLFEAYQLFELVCRARRRTKSSMDYYRRRLKSFLAYCDEQGASLLTDVDANLIRRYFIDLGDGGLADHFVHGGSHVRRALLRSLWTGLRALLPFSLPIWSEKRLENSTAFHSS